ncbi:hypothetical protein [Paractinoplanes atraurantiacus]|uniref:Uncharacterized protein n=1 Tax=Paractinoplanes atraurantiacus TaxID=1036182 RepID=A0A285K417_9ACTN|nr:hypothetical protein [Actinoplanes atraurantiacus]SNY66081.1 hypothetical protein SAMN05421748_12969 [Actinoplanes atraurantiacus]
MPDVVTFGSDKRFPVVGAVVVLLLALVAFLFFNRGGSEEAAPVTVTPSLCTGSAPAPSLGFPSAVTGASPVAIVIEGACTAGAALDRRDTVAGAGPWTIVVRRPGGSLGHDGAVITYPVAPSPGAASPAAPSTAAPSAAARGMVVKALGGEHVRVRGDLPVADLRAIADRVRLSGGRPVLTPPAGLSVVASGTYRPASIREVRYGTADLGEREALGGGLTFTGVAAAGGYEDHLYATGSLSSVFGGNGAIAWEPQPGLIAFIGYSGAERSEAADEALKRLAGRARAINGDGWRSTPTVAVQSNDIP